MRSNKLTARPLAGVALAVGLAFFLPGSTLSQTPFYQGKTITLLQSTQAGDTSDTMTRALVPFLKKHVPGEPTIKFDFMPGSGGTKAANHIFSNVRPDGLTIGRIGGDPVANAIAVDNPTIPPPMMTTEGSPDMSVVYQADTGT